MNLFKKSAIALTLTSSLLACSDGSNSQSDTRDDLNSTEPESEVENNASARDEADIPNDAVDQPVDSATGISTRSPQGIPDGAGDRRDRVRNNRRQGVRGDTVTTDNREIQSYDGTGNNAQNPEWGASFSHLQRIGEATYSDGIGSMIFTDRAGPREISNTIVNQEEGESIINPLGVSDFSWQWGQFIDHDIDLTDGAEEEANIPVPVGDIYFDPAGSGTAFIPFNRALYDHDTGTDASNVREQENEISSWIDGSMIYGSDDERAEALREGPNSPFMKVSAGNLLPFNTDNLLNANGPVEDPATLFLAGDIRANEQVGLAAMHTLFVREHNRLAALLMQQNPGFDAETLFQATRRLVIAELQIITYNEHLPALVGNNALPAYSGYDASINPTIYNEFSAAAYRLGHSMVSETLQRLDSGNNTIAEGPLSLRNAFFTAPQILQSESDVEPVLRGLASQVHQALDTKVIHTLRNLLFGAPGSGGLDLISLNIQRGRDHGLPYYNDMRIAMGLIPVTSFNDISSDLELNQSLQDAYGDVEKIDLWVGGMAEEPLTEQGSLLGELFRAIVIRQFTELRDGDRFWYQNHLSEDELDMVRGTTLARVIRNNTDIGRELSDTVFYVTQ